MLYTVIVFDMGAGVFTNLKTANFLVKFLSYISPLNYANQLMMRYMLDESSYQEIALDFYHYNYEESTCYAMLFSFIVIYFLIGWTVLYIKSRQI